MDDHEIQPFFVEPTLFYTNLNVSRPGSRRSARNVPMEIKAHMLMKTADAWGITWMKADLTRDGHYLETGIFGQ